MRQNLVDQLIRTVKEMGKDSDSKVLLNSEFV